MLHDASLAGMSKARGRLGRRRRDAVPILLCDERVGRVGYLGDFRWHIRQRDLARGVEGGVPSGEGSVAVHERRAVGSGGAREVVGVGMVVSGFIIVD